jgi:hypothetical protein
VNGDGRADAIAIGHNRMAVLRSDGSKFLSPDTWVEDSFYGERGTFFADVNGDRRADVIDITFDQVAVRLSNGQRFEAVSTWWQGFF